MDNFNRIYNFAARLKSKRNRNLRVKATGNNPIKKTSSSIGSMQFTE